MTPNVNPGDARSQVTRIFLTGASGCVGHYVLEILLAESSFEVVALVRDSEKLPADCRDHPRLTVVTADLTQQDGTGAYLHGIDVAILLAASWGGPEAFAVNLEANLAISRALDAQGCRKIIYFATASVLDREGLLLEAANRLGTDYIRSKFCLVQAMEAALAKAEVIGLFPTLVVGGDHSKPYSHFARLLRQSAAWARLIAHFQVEGQFHFIHAQDIAQVVYTLVQAPSNQAKRLVLGGPKVEANAAIAAFARLLDERALIRIPLKRWATSLLIWIFRIKLSPWDEYCLEHPDQSFVRLVSPASFGLPTYCPDFETAARSVGIGASGLSSK